MSSRKSPLIKTGWPLRAWKLGWSYGEKHSETASVARCLKGARRTAALGRMSRFSSKAAIARLKAIHEEQIKLPKESRMKEGAARFPASLKKVSELFTHVEEGHRAYLRFGGDRNAALHPKWPGRGGVT